MTTTAARPVTDAATRERLRALIREIDTRSPRPAPPPAFVPRVPGAAEVYPHEDMRPVTPRGLPVPLESMPGARLRVTASGTCVVREVRRPLAAPAHLVATGEAFDLGELPRMVGAPLVRLAPDAELEDAALEDLLFLDIETTGLGGSGAMVFLVTTGQLIADGFRIRQYLAPSPAEEGDLLTQLATDSGVRETRPVLATYNGRVFDAPMLDQRSTMHRMRGGYEALTQLDVLSPMRHGFRTTLPSCRLSAVEYDLLQVTRPPDEVGGAEIPGWYFRFVRGGDHRYLEPLITHNAIDVLSLAALTARLAAVVAGTVEATGVEQLAAGRLWLRAGDFSRAERHLSAAIDALEDGWVYEQALLTLALLHKRAGRRELAAPLWARVVERPQGPALPTLIELAKYHEHATRDYAAALSVVERAIASVGCDAALLHRRSRLLRRLGRDDR